jgi:hypothetical protein
MPKVLSADDIDQFVEKGHCLLRDAFPRELCDDALAQVWAEMPCSRSDPGTWTQQLHRVQRVFQGGPFAESWTPRVVGAIDDLLGAGRWHRPRFQGWWSVIFPGFEEGPWQPPEKGWHVDGGHFHHHLDSADQALLPIFVWSDIDAGDGGTALAEGSHRITARLLAESGPHGLDAPSLTKLVQATPRPSVVEAQAKAGDVVLLHPFMAHARSANCGTRVRFISNPCIAFRQTMDLAKPQSVVERSIADMAAEAHESA